MPDTTPDRLAITDVLHEYAAAIDERDWARLTEVFSSDAILDYRGAGGPRGPRDEVTAWISDALGAVAFTQHVITNIRVDVDGASARSRSYLLNPLGLDDGAVLLVGGEYRDRWERRSGRWWIVERVHDMQWRTGPLPGSSHDTATQAG